MMDNKKPPSIIDDNVVVDDDEEPVTSSTPSMEDIHLFLSDRGGKVSFLKKLKRSTYSRILSTLAEGTDPTASLDVQINRIADILELVEVWTQKRGDEDAASIVYDESTHWSKGPRKIAVEHKRAEALRVCVGMLRDKQISLNKEKKRYLEMVSSFESMMTGTTKPMEAPSRVSDASPKDLPLIKPEVCLHQQIVKNMKKDLDFSTNVRKSLKSMKSKTEEMERRRVELEKVLRDLQTQSQLESLRLEKELSKEEEEREKKDLIIENKPSIPSPSNDSFRQEVQDAIRKWSTSYNSSSSLPTKPRESTMISTTSTLCSLLSSTLTARRARLTSNCSDIDSPDMMSPGYGIMYDNRKEENWRLTHEASEQELKKRAELAKSLSLHLSSPKKRKNAENESVGIATFGLAAVSVVVANVRERLRKKSSSV